MAAYLTELCFILVQCTTNQWAAIGSMRQRERQWCSVNMSLVWQLAWADGDRGIIGAGGAG